MTVNHTPLEETLLSFSRGEPAAIHELFERWRPLLKLQAIKLLGAELSARVDPADVVQDSLTQAHEQLDHFRGRTIGEWITWLRSIVVEQTAKPLRLHYTEKLDLNPEIGVTRSWVDRSETPEDEVQRCELSGRLAEAVEQLPDAMRTAVVGRVVLQQSWEEIAKLLDKSPGAARVLWMHALKRLRDSEAEL